jgi:2-polyprenyl-6-methoxyphenol hydroxylase-like FAD-dependent oxidoreductase
MAMQILIVGGGIGGLTAALALHACVPAARIRVLEAAPEIRPLGVGINLLPHAGRELSRLGLRDALSRVAVEPTERLYFTHHGQLIYREAAGVHAGYEWPHFSIHRGDLQMVLYGAVEERLGAETVLCGRRCIGVEQDEGGVTAHVADATGRPLPPLRADLLIACDGIHSAVRKAFYPGEREPVFHGINMWRGVTRAKPFLSGSSAARIGGLHTTGKLVVYPIRRDIDGAGTQLINWVAEIVTETREAVDWSKPGRLEDFYGTIGIGGSPGSTRRRFCGTPISFSASRWSIAIPSIAGRSAGSPCWAMPPIRCIRVAGTAAPTRSSTRLRSPAPWLGNRRPRRR